MRAKPLVERIIVGSRLKFFFKCFFLKGALFSSNEQGTKYGSKFKFLTRTQNPECCRTQISRVFYESFLLLKNELADY